MTTPALGFVTDRVCSCHAEYRQRFRRPRLAANVTLLSLSLPQRFTSNGDGLNIFLVTFGPCAKARLKPGTTAQFLITSRLHCEIRFVVLDLAPSNRLHDDALIHATRGHPTARGLEQWRRPCAGEISPVGATRIAPTRSPLHEPGARRAHASNHCRSQ